MPAKYSVIQYVPDPIADERVNIGVVVFDKYNVLVRFLKRWTRVKRFARIVDVEFLERFASECIEAASPDLLLPSFERFPKLDGERILTMAHSWRNSIQLTEPRGSIKSVDDLLSEMATRFLVEQNRTTRDYRDKQAAARIVRAKIRVLLNERFGPTEAKTLLDTDGSLDGANTFHHFDAVVRNGAPYFAVDALSFELPRATNLDLQINAKAFSLVDVLANRPKLPIGIFTLPPTNAQTPLASLYHETVKTYTSIGVNILTEDTVTGWTKDMLNLIPREH